MRVLINDENKFKSLTQEILKELLHYDSDTGIFTWKERSIEYFSHCKDPKQSRGTWNTKFSNIVAEHKYKNYKSFYNRICISLNGKSKVYKAHRLAFLYMIGSFPENQIDHKDQNGFNNSWSNLRKVTNQENHKNMPIQSNNTSGFTGVTWRNDRNKWNAQIMVNKKHISGGLFIKLEDAIIRRKELNIEYGFHENHGRINKE